MWITPKSDREERLVSVAANTGGYFTAKQALECGYSYRLQNYHREKGHWEGINRGVFRLTNYPDSPHEDLILWFLWSKNRGDIPQAVISHESALTVYESGNTMASKIHLTVPPGFRKNPPKGCVLHYSKVNPNEIQHREGLNVTSPLRTIIDVAESGMSADYLESAVRDLYAKGLINPASLENISVSHEAKNNIHLVLNNIRRSPFSYAPTPATARTEKI